MATTDTDFTATGPATVGFQATGQQTLDVGVEASAKQYGVHGRAFVGVLGDGSDDGVEGRGHRGRGGRFASRAAAQVNLVPHKMRTPAANVPTHPEQHREAALPRHAEPGDLWLGAYASHQTHRQTCALWLCVEGDHDEQPAHWREVLLGTPVPGQV